MTKIVFSDIDGTLLNPQYQITPLTLKAIKDLQNNGIPFVIISARSPSGIYPILEEYSFNCPIISYSGALILDVNKNILFHKGIKKAAARKIIEFMEENHFDLAWCIYSYDEWFVKDKNDPRIINEEAEVKAYASQGSVDCITADEVSKILCICNPLELLETERKLKEAFPDYSIAKSSDCLLEIMENGITKASAIRTLSTIWDFQLSDAVAFGDNYNDAEMLQLAGYGFLMGNAPDELKKRIRLHTSDNSHDGIYHALSGLKLV